MASPSDTIAFVGDVHGQYGRFAALVEEALMDVAAVLQLGDVGYLHLDRGVREYVPPPRPVHFIDGNHDSYPLFRGLEEPTEVRENLIYVPRGWVLEPADGFRVGCLGGADSIDRPRRTEDVTWFPDEQITYADERRLVQRHLEAPVTMMATHTPPASVVRRMGFPDPSPCDLAVERAWRELGEVGLVCGHMHQRVRFGRVQVLGELDVLRVPTSAPPDLAR